jgi:hypothetical protein
MKAIFLTSVLAVLFSLNIYAGNPKNKVYSNIENNEYGCTKEYTIVDGQTSKALRKVAFFYDANGNIQEKSCYTWNEVTGWIGTQKYEYEYNSDGHKLANLIYTEWDKEIATWSAKSQHLIHVYDINGELLTVKQFKVNNDYNGLIANK